MDAIDRIREEAREGVKFSTRSYDQAVELIVDFDEIEALCDLADAAHRLIEGLDYAYGWQGIAMARYQYRPREDMRNALSRLEGGDLMAEDRTIPTLAMQNEPRLRRLFALAGRVLHDDVEDPDVEGKLTDVLMEIAPEFVPPDEDEHVPEWWQICAEAFR